MSKQTYQIAIDGNEANIENRVGSNVYAFELITALEKLTRKKKNIAITVLLRNEAISALPKARSGWDYQVIAPQKLWTQWALPLHLFLHRDFYQLLFSPGHYVPHLCPIPYVSTVMDTAYIDYPEHFKEKDRLQLTNWTERAVQKAKKIIAISEATKRSVSDHYGKNPNDIEVAYPAFTASSEELGRPDKKKFYTDQEISKPFLLFVGTLQPRKNLVTLIEAFEIFSRMIAARTLESKRSRRKAPKYKPAKLVLAGKIGWMADDILKRIENSPMKKRIIRTDFISEAEKQSLYKDAFASILIGLHEGFGIPPLESMAHQTPAIVSNTTSLPEVVGKAGLTVDPTNPQAIAEKIWEAYTMSTRNKAVFKRQAKAQLKKFSWDKSAQTVLETLQEVIDNQA